MKKILFIINNLGSGGAQRQIVTVAKLIKKKGNEVTVLCYSPQDFFYTELQNENIPVCWKIEKNALLRIIKVRNYVRKGHYDAVVSFLHTENILNVLSSLGGKKWIVICGERSAKEGIFDTRRGKIHGWLMRFADAIVCNSENARRMWMRHYPSYKNKYSVIYNNVQIGDLTTTYAPQIQQKIRIVIAASYQYLKNPLGLVEGVRLLSKEEQERLQIDWYGRREVVAGDTKAYDEMNQLIKRYKLNNVFQLHEENRDILNIMNQADAVGLFSWVEGLPNCICEAMMLGKPVVMTRVSDYSVLIDKDNGFLCDWNDYHSIKEAVTALLNKDEMHLLEMGEASKRKAQMLFSEEIVTNKWMNLIEG